MRPVQTKLSPSKLQRPKSNLANNNQFVDNRSANDESISGFDSDFPTNDSITIRSPGKDNNKPLSPRRNNNPRSPEHKHDVFDASGTLPKPDSVTVRSPKQHLSPRRQPKARQTDLNNTEELRLLENQVTLENTDVLMSNINRMSQNKKSNEKPKPKPKLEIAKQDSFSESSTTDKQIEELEKQAEKENSILHIPKRNKSNQSSPSKSPKDESKEMKKPEEKNTTKTNEKDFESIDNSSTTQSDDIKKEIKNNDENNKPKKPKLFKDVPKENKKEPKKDNNKSFDGSDIPPKQPTKADPVLVIPSKQNPQQSRKQKQSNEKNKEALPDLQEQKRKEKPKEPVQTNPFNKSLNSQTFPYELNKSSSEFEKNSEDDHTQKKVEIDQHKEKQKTSTSESEGEKNKEKPKETNHEDSLIATGPHANRPLDVHPKKQNLPLHDDDNEAMTFEVEKKLDLSSDSHKSTQSNSRSSRREEHKEPEPQPIQIEEEEEEEERAEFNNSHEISTHSEEVSHHKVGEDTIHPSSQIIPPPKSDDEEESHESSKKSKNDQSEESANSQEFSDEKKKRDQKKKEERRQIIERAKSILQKDSNKKKSNKHFKQQKETDDDVNEDQLNRITAVLIQKVAKKMEEIQQQNNENDDIDQIFTHNLNEADREDYENTKNAFRKELDNELPMPEQNQSLLEPPFDISNVHDNDDPSHHSYLAETESPKKKPNKSEDVPKKQKEKKEPKEDDEKFYSYDEYSEENVKDPFEITDNSTKQNNSTANQENPFNLESAQSSSFNDPNEIKVTRKKDKADKKPTPVEEPPQEDKNDEIVVKKQNKDDSNNNKPQKDDEDFEEEEEFIYYYYSDEDDDIKVTKKESKPEKGNDESDPLYHPVTATKVETIPVEKPKPEKNPSPKKSPKKESVSSPKKANNEKSSPKKETVSSPKKSPKKEKDNNKAKDDKEGTGNVPYFEDLSLTGTQGNQLEYYYEEEEVYYDEEPEDQEKPSKQKKSPDSPINEKDIKRKVPKLNPTFVEDKSIEEEGEIKFDLTDPLKSTDQSTTKRKPKDDNKFTDDSFLNTTDWD